MTVRELLEQLADHAADGRRTEDQVILVVGKETRSVTATYSDGTFVLTAGPPLNN